MPDLRDLQSEAQFRKAVLDYAKLAGWLACYIPDSRRNVGDAGLPDLILARGGRVILAELKTSKGRLRDGQKCWLEEAGGNGRVWRPGDWEDIERDLR